MIYTVTLNPALDKTVEIPSLAIDAVNRITAMRTDPGGKGINVSKVITKLGEVSMATGILGGNTGQKIRSALEQMGISSFFRFIAGETRTNLKIIDPVNHTNTDLNEPGVTVSREILEELRKELLNRVKPGDIVVISGSVPDGTPKDTYAIWTAACRQKGAKVFLDADGELLAIGIEASPYLIKPNIHELSHLAKRNLETPDQIEQTVRKLIFTYGIKKVVVSMGSAGALYVTEQESVYAKGLTVPVGSTVGAGDSMVAALAVAEERGLSLEETARLSTATGAANVMCSGTQAAEYETVAKLMPKVVLQKNLK